VWTFDEKATQYIVPAGAAIAKLLAVREQAEGKLGELEGKFADPDTTDYIKGTSTEGIAYLEPLLSQINQLGIYAEASATGRNVKRTLSATDTRKTVKV
jgi:hypothetical protein